MSGSTGRVLRRAAYGVWEGIQPGVGWQEAAVVAGCWGGRLPSDWEISDCELFAIFAYLRRIVDRSADPSKERVLVLSDCKTALQKLDSVWREGSTRFCKTKDSGALVEAMAAPARAAAAGVRRDAGQRGGVKSGG